MYGGSCGTRLLGSHKGHLGGKGRTLVVAAWFRHPLAASHSYSRSMEHVKIPRKKEEQKKKKKTVVDIGNYFKRLMITSMNFFLHIPRIAVSISLFIPLCWQSNL